MKSILATLFWEAAETALVLYAVLSASSGAENLVIFIANMHLLLSPFILLAAFWGKELEQERRPVWVLKTVSYCDFSRAVILAWFGWWFCAWAFLAGFIASALLREQRIERAKAAATKAAA